MDATQLIIGPTITSLLGGIALILLLYWYSTRNHHYWKKRNVPFVPPLPLFGTVLDLMLKPLHETELNRYRKYGQIYGHYEGTNPVLSIADPVLIKKILVKDFLSFPNRRTFQLGDSIMENNLVSLQGEDWKRVRSIMSPTFTTGKLKKIFSIIMDSTETCLNNYKKYAKSGEPVDLKKIYSAFTMDLIASSAFSTKLDSYSDPNNKFVTAARHILQGLNCRLLFFLVLFQRLCLLFGFSALSPKGMNFFKTLVLEIVEERKNTAKVRNDFLQLMMNAVKENEEKQASDELESEDLTEIYENVNEDREVLKTVEKKTLSNNELIAQCIIFLLAGHETTSSALSFATYLLTINPDTQEKLFLEVKETLSSTCGEITYEAIQNMKYLDCVISETLRLFSPAVRFERVAAEDYDLGVMGIKIPKGMLVTIPAYAVHKDPKYFPDPEKFDPDRFSPEERAKRDPNVYMPFGMGPRNCVGMRFALLVTKISLAIVIKNFRIVRCSETKVPIEFAPGTQGMSPKEVKVKIEIREDNIRATE
ncbi:cytochrome P450 3A8-like [Uloborus diversus]|uniref:cytochrome P450 3A8-like n=1 Tax=Uloborus diversus TaxID=327109 RepID=UPI0024098371|nr:cytochrome P450 3A8-like [Uloborus diversus]